MADPMIGEIRLFPYGFAPENWVMCDGRQLPIRGNEALYSIIGSIYGSDLKTYFQVPDLRSRVAVGFGDDPQDTFDPTIGSHGGTEKETLTVAQTPSHTHALVGATIPNLRQEVETPAGNWLSSELRIKPVKGSEIANAFSSQTPNATMTPNTLSGFVGGGQPHENRQPYLVVGYYIATNGEYPVRP